MRPTGRHAVLAVLLATSVTGAGEPPRPYGGAARVAYVKEALTALAEAPPAALEQGIAYARAMERGACAAGAQRLRVECLMVAVQHYCRDHDHGDSGGRLCPLYMDVIVSNALADQRLIPPERRYQIVRANLDYRPALARELRRIQGAMATDFRLQTGDADDTSAMAANIDRYCLGAQTLAYQTCVSSLVWFIKGPT